MIEKLKILHLSPYYLPATNMGGSVIAVANLAEMSAKLKHKVYVITSNYNGNDKNKKYKKMEIINDVRIYRVLPVFSFLGYLFFPNIIHLINEIQPDIIHIHQIFNNFGEQITKSNLVKSPVIIFSPHGTYDKKGVISRDGSRLLQFLHTIYQNYSNIPKIANSISICSSEERYNMHNFQNKSTLIQLGSNFSSEIMTRYEISEESNSIIFISVGRIAQNKRTIEIIQFFEQIWKVDNRFKLYLVGGIADNYIFKIKSKISSLSYEIRKNIKIFGHLERKEIMKLLSKSQFFIQKSRRENYSLALLEALMIGLIPICYPTGLALDFIISDKFGFLVDDKYESNKLITEIIQLSNNKKKMNQMSLGIIAKAAKLSDNNFVDQTIKMYYKQLIKFHNELNK